MFYKIYGSCKYWFRPTSSNNSRFEVIKLKSSTVNGDRKIEVFSRIINLCEYDHDTIISHWLSNGRTFEDAYQTFRSNVLLYKGDMAHKIAETVGNFSIVADFNNYDDLTTYMNEIQARNFSIVDFLSERN